jgi:hypothetical protein
VDNCARALLQTTFVYSNVVAVSHLSPLMTTASETTPLLSVQDNSNLANRATGGSTVPYSSLSNSSRVYSSYLNPGNIQNETKVQEGLRSRSKIMISRKTRERP